MHIPNSLLNLSLWNNFLYLRVQILKTDFFFLFLLLLFGWQKPTSLSISLSLFSLFPSLYIFPFSSSPSSIQYSINGQVVDSIYIKPPLCLYHFHSHWQALLYLPDSCSNLPTLTRLSPFSILPTYILLPGVGSYKGVISSFPLAPLPSYQVIAKTISLTLESPLYFLT